MISTATNSRIIRNIERVLSKIIEQHIHLSKVDEQGKSGGLVESLGVSTILLRKAATESLTVNLETTRTTESTLQQKIQRTINLKRKLKYVLAEFSANSTNNIHCYVNCVKRKFKNLFCRSTWGLRTIMEYKVEAGKYLFWLFRQEV